MRWGWLIYLRECRLPRHSLSTNKECRIIEANFVIICGCLPFLRQFLRHHAPRLLGDGSNTSSSETRYQTKGVILRRLRVHTTTSDTLEQTQSEEIPRMTAENPQYTV
jgi:hypothetical protein